jgi:hypothetical protein
LKPKLAASPLEGPDARLIVRSACRSQWSQFKAGPTK